jgi:hypothetical protein
MILSDSIWAYGEECVKDSQLYRAWEEAGRADTEPETKTNVRGFILSLSYYGFQIMANYRQDRDLRPGCFHHEIVVSFSQLPQLAVSSKQKILDYRLCYQAVVPHVEDTCIYIYTHFSRESLCLRMNNTAPRSNASGFEATTTVLAYRESRHAPPQL